MSREIKFRAWNPNSNRFDSYAGDIHMSLGEAGALWSKNIPMEFQEYTGLKDKNGVEIYEGDIYNYFAYPDSPYTARRAVTWVEKSTYTGFNLSKGHSGNQLERVEVIGNIYENPELVA